jgi:tetratricopeptide (TPR) repeat protein
MVLESDDLVRRPFLHAFVGRERELGELRAGLGDAFRGRGRLFLIVGEPGIGKTRLAEEASAFAAAGGARVVWGRCWEGGGAPAYWPWVQVFRTLADTLDDDTLRRVVGDAAGQLGALVPALAARWGRGEREARSLGLVSEHERFPLFDAASGMLRRLAAERPLVLVLDDLHAADEPSLLLLEFLARELRGAPMLVLCTYRDLEVQRDAERSHILGAAARSGHRLPLAGLSEQEVERLVRSTLELGDERGLGDLAERVYRTTDGNPFFVDEILHLFLADPGRGNGNGGEVSIPHGVRDAVRERLRPLSEACRTALATAAVVGREFDLATIQAVDATPMDSLLDALGEGEAAGVIVWRRGSVGRYAFCHALIRDTLYDEIPSAQRARLHWRVAESMARRVAGGEEPLAELAHHYFRGAPVGDPEKAVAYARRAGERAAALLAYEEAASCFQQALEALSLLPQRDDAGRIELLLALGTAQAHAWNTTSAQQTFAEAGALARELRAGSPGLAAPLLARAALGFGGTGLGVPRGQKVDETLVALLESALEGLGESDSALRARVLSRLAVELYFTDAAERRAALCDEASRLARLSGDESALAYVVSAQHFALWDSPDVDLRLALANEAVELSRRTGEPDIEVVARLWRVLDLLEKGAVGRWEAEIDELEAVARALRQPRPLAFAATLRAMRALWRSRFGEVEAFGQQGLAIGQRAQDQGATINFNIQRFGLLRARGEQDEALPMVELWMQVLPSHPTLRCMRALLFTDLGRLDEARAEFDRIAEDDFAELRRLNSMPTLLPWLSEICAALGDAPRAETLVIHLRRHLNRNLLGGPRILFGPAEHWAGVLAAVVGRLDEAEALLERAAERSRAMDGAAAAAWSECERAAALVRRDHPGDAERAGDLLQVCTATAEHLGLGHLGRRVRSRLDELERRAEPATLRASAGAGGGVAPRAKAGARVLSFRNKGGGRPRPVAEVPRHATGDVYGLRREGEFWTVSDGESVLRLKDTKGLRYIAHLLRSPDREFHVLDLVAPERASAGAAAESLGGVGEKQLQRLGMHTTSDTDAGEKLLDAQARAAYQRRLEDLRDDLEEATRFNDPERAARARHEMEFLAAELARAVGLGGRARSTASGAERARLNVTRAIKAVVRRIARANPNLGRYLETTLRTGAFCSYRPDPRMKVTWKL